MISDRLVIIHNLVLCPLFSGKIAQEVRAGIINRVVVIHIPHPRSAIIVAGNEGFPIGGERCPFPGAGALY